MAKAKDKQEQSTEFIKTVSQRLRTAIAKLGLSQADVIQLCQENGFTISRSTLSKILNDSSPSGITVTNISNLASALCLDLNQLLSTSESCEIRVPTSNEETFISHKDSPRLKNYIGHYHLLMYRTISEENDPIKGTLDIQKTSGSNSLTVHIKINVDRNYTEKSTITKEYFGTLRLSTRMRAIYITCSNEEICEDIFIILPYLVLDFEKLYSRIGLALVSSAGVNRVPTAQRILITSKELSEVQEKIAFGQLLLNKADIRISVDQFKKFLEDKDLPNSFRETFVNGDELSGSIKRTYYHINEATIRGSGLSLSDRMMSVGLLRYYSDSPKYTKVSSKANELTYRLLKELENSTEPVSESIDSL